MPLTAAAAGTIIDLTVDPVDQIIDTVTTSPLACPVCDDDVRFVLDLNHHAFFEHTGLPLGCPLLGETPAERRIKATIAATVADLDHWTVDLEQVLVDDLVAAAVAAAGTETIVFDLTPADCTLDEASARLEAWSRAGGSPLLVATTWAPWLFRAAGVAVDPYEDRVVAGRARFDAGHDRFRPVPGPDLDAFIVAYLTGAFTTATGPALAGQVAIADDATWVEVDNATVLVSSSERWHHNPGHPAPTGPAPRLRRLEDRQQHLLGPVLADLASRHGHTRFEIAVRTAEGRRVIEVSPNDPPPADLAGDVTFGGGVAVRVPGRSWPVAVINPDPAAILDAPTIVRRLAGTALYSTRSDAAAITSASGGRLWPSDPTSDLASRTVPQTLLS